MPAVVALLLVALAACSSAPPTAQRAAPGEGQLVRSAFGQARYTEIMEQRCWSCIDDKVPKVVVHPEYAEQADVNLKRAVAAIESNNLVLAIQYFTFLHARFPESDPEAQREIAARKPLIDAALMSCRQRCSQCTSDCTDIAGACGTFCAVDFPVDDAP